MTDCLWSLKVVIIKEKMLFSSCQDGRHSFHIKMKKKNKKIDPHAVF